MSHSCFERWHLDLEELLGLAVPPVAIAFISHVPAGIERIQRTTPPRTADGRTGAVAASCVFWIEGTQGVFATEAEDHGNCSVGSLTHGFKTMEEIAQNADVAALCETGWVTPEAVAKVAVVREKPTSIVYGPLRDMPVEPSVILLRLNGKQQMLLHDAWRGLRFEGKPQCHIIPIAKESGELAVSVGCMLSRVRTGMSNNEVTCAIPASRMSLLIERLCAARAADNAVAAYAAEDSKRFGRQQ
ncbi:MAG: DUF169 domain-containing protein [Burkholderiales bacterium]|jgi:uncharacterized protein (DUF169 family)